MPAPRINMRKLKDALRLKFEGQQSHQQIATALGISKGVVTKYAGLAVAARLDWPAIAAMDAPRRNLTLALGASLCVVGGGILWDAALRLQTIQAGAPLPPVALMALWVAIATVFFKEALYRYLIRIARQLNSKLMAANAMHTRADAASALVVVAGVGGALAGWPALDLVAALLMGFMILKLGVELSWGALRELIDEGLNAEEVVAIRASLQAVPGVLEVSIGHALIAVAIVLGLVECVRDYQRCIRSAAGAGRRG